MIYAIRQRNGRETLVELGSVTTLRVENGLGKGPYRQVPPSIARQWVKDGKEHETALWVDEGRVRRAKTGA